MYRIQSKSYKRLTPFEEQSIRDYIFQRSRRGVVSLDIDGTVLVEYGAEENMPSGGISHSRIRRTIRKVQDLGFLVFPLSGRMVDIMKHLPEDLGLHHPLAGEYGNRVYFPQWDLHTTFEKSIPDEMTGRKTRFWNFFLSFLGPAMEQKHLYHIGNSINDLSPPPVRMLAVADADTALLARAHRVSKYPCTRGALDQLEYIYRVHKNE